MLEIAVSPDARSPEAALTELGWDPRTVGFALERNCVCEHIAAGGVFHIVDQIHHALYRYRLSAGQNIVATENVGTLYLRGWVRAVRDSVDHAVGRI